ncbi:NOL1/NOP2/sun domain protein [Aspergillus flavus]|uniref:Fmu (Sun) domain protein n=2 Tax=Aspergillus oryzae TaxID=5062 RepID=A0A1S9DYM8_ASPOZ|nr:proliferation-associated nucleolar protein [Aspergillus oryzae 3.042]KAJ1716856.1 NOL1/NOP2/sun domain protein [Aspergillus flavus]KDE85053.1 proliferation-associated nucleolar protein [Aspergillus oryzae 100-8]OOO14144.1 Fmu (Sun) domain protein [Aspergillus oryzae]RAQ70515.1 NOL1/NOP2/sun domain protein [Aspergillus flavus]|eukprot:EIT75195.1 proliferation-associated nucleolar protein [Aspergillus oryzae 3.042]
MSLYYDAVKILTSPSPTGGSFKSRIYNARNIKANPAQIYALTIEASKWDTVLKEVIDNAGILKLEPKLTPLLALLLVHDHLLAKNGIAAPSSHPIRQAIERHKTRLKGEFIKARVRRGCASVEQLKDAVQKEKQPLGSAAFYPRWIRINNVRTTAEKQFESTFASYKRVNALSELAVKDDTKRIYVDSNIPDLVAVAPGVDFTATPAYKNGEIILQDKASCFPAYLLFGEGSVWSGGDLVDGCAAPGNKTTHLASLLCKNEKRKKPRQRIISMDASQVRAKTLQKMVSAAGADHFTTVLPGQDFLALDPEDERFEKVSALLLDPSCSGSGIIGRDDVPKFVLPVSPAEERKKQGKKRKRGQDEAGDAADGSVSMSATDENEMASTHLDLERLTKLSNLQTRIVEHAMSFPAATRITYSTCSIHLTENESVVERLLTSEVAKRRGWRIMRRNEQPEGLRTWKHRGVRTESRGSGDSETQDGTQGAELKVDLSDEVLEGCLRCWPGDDEGLGGFFVAGFVRDESLAGKVEDPQHGHEDKSEDDDGEDEDDEDEWAGFSD